MEERTYKFPFGIKALAQTCQDDLAEEGYKSDLVSTKRYPYCVEVTKEGRDYLRSKGFKEIASRKPKATTTLHAYKTDGEWRSK